VGDLVVAIDEHMVNSINALHRFLADWPIGSPVTLAVLRERGQLAVRVSLVEAR
jgi:S1-C subfamily serine protease